MEFKIGDFIYFESKYSEKKGYGEIVEIESGSNNKSYLVKLLSHLKGTGHNGNGHSKKKYDTNDYFFVDPDFDEARKARRRININERDGYIEAVLIVGNEAVKTIRIKANMSCLFIFNSLVAVTKLLCEFTPHLKTDDGDFCGRIGEETNIYDIRGEQLFVGDVVTLIDTRSKTNEGTAFVAEPDNDYPIVYGIAGSCTRSGEINGRWIVLKEKSYKDLSNGETHCHVTAVLEDD